MILELAVGSAAYCVTYRLTGSDKKAFVVGNAGRIIGAIIEDFVW